MKQFIGTCVNNPFSTTQKLCSIIDEAKEITKTTFLKYVDLDETTLKEMQRFPYDYTYYRNREVFFFTWSAIEHFFT